MTDPRQDAESRYAIGRIAERLSRHAPRPRDGAEPDRFASVAIILREVIGAGPEVLVIRRSEHPTDPWSGHMALPGGRKDPRDASTRHAAEREVMEEVGLDLAATGHLLGRLDDVAAVARGQRLGLTIAPFVYAIAADRAVALTLNHEVQEALWVPFSDLAGPDHRSTRTYPMGGGQVELPCWRWNDRVIWGLTYNMLSTLIQLVESEP